MFSRPLFTSPAFPLLINWILAVVAAAHVFPRFGTVSIGYTFSRVWHQSQFFLSPTSFWFELFALLFFLVTRWLLSGWFIRWTINRGSVAKQREISAASREEFKNATITGDFGSVRKTRTTKNSLSYLDNLWEECKTSERACVTCQRGWTEQLVTRMLV